LGQGFQIRILFGSKFLLFEPFQVQKKKLISHSNSFFLPPNILSESGANSYESGIMVSKAVEITINGKLLKPAGKLKWC